MSKDTVYIVDVPVATLWTSDDSARVIDNPALQNPCVLSEWIERLDYDRRLELCTKNLVQSQVLFGQEVLVQEIKAGWAKVLVPKQTTSKNKTGYPGWIPLTQLKQNSSYTFAGKKIAVVSIPIAKLFDNELHAVMEVSYQTTLPVCRQKEEWTIVQTSSGERWIKTSDICIFDSSSKRLKGNGARIVEEGEKFLHLEYLWGGMSAYGYDCSGFSYTMCKANGYSIPRDAHEQADTGKEIPLDQMEPGDLLFFAHEEGKGKIHHVGIYYGSNKLLHSPKTGETIKIEPMLGTLYEKELCAVRRYWE
ncbi:C40 family peptidase [Niallia sp. 03133]|uniref:C40 family peptidase n=1 Tax=Niallia sp. 03133 TaxID=3458060 RepID=UPI0040440BB1